MGRGNSYAFGPPPASDKQARDGGWDFRGVTHWDFTEGRRAA